MLNSKTQLICYSLAIMLASSCNSKKQALNFNDKVAHFCNILADKGAAIGPVLKLAFYTHDFSKLKMPCDDIRKTIENDIEDLTKMHNVSGSEDLKSAMLYYFSFENNLIEKYFVPFTYMDNKTADEDIQRAIKNLQQAIKEEGPVLARLKEVQHEYASKNGFMIAKDK